MSDGFGGDFLAIGEPWEWEQALILTAEGSTYLLFGGAASLIKVGKTRAKRPKRTPFVNLTEARYPSYEYQDLQMNVQNVQIPASQAPTWRQYNYGISGGITFPALGFDLNEYVTYVLQTTHAVVIKSDMHLHAHFTIPSGTADRVIRFRTDVIFGDVNGNWSIPTGSPYYGEFTTDGTEHTMHNVMSLANIQGVNEEVSTIMHLKISRVAASAGTDYSGEVYVNFFDCHVMTDSIGSIQEYVK